MDGTFKSVWAAADDHCIKAMQHETKISSSNNVNWPMFTDSWKQSNNNDSNKDADENKFNSNSCAKKTNLAHSQSRGLYTVSPRYEGLKPQTSKDFEAIPEEFRPNETARYLLPVKTKPASENVKMFNCTNKEPNYIQKHASCYQKNVRSTERNFRNVTSKDIKWNDNLQPDSSEIEQHPSQKLQDSHLESKYVKQQNKGICVRNPIPNHSLQGNYKGNSKSYGRRNQKQNYPRFNLEKSRVNEIVKKHQSPSVTVLSKVTKLQVVTPEKQVTTKKTVQTWTTNSFDEVARKKRENKTGPDEALLENTLHKSVGKKMTWMEDLCTVKDISETDQITFEYISKSKREFSPRDSKETFQQEKCYSFSDNLRSNSDKKNLYDSKSSKNVFVDHAEEFIRAQRRFKSEPVSQKFERINLSNMQSKEGATVIEHVVKVIHMNHPNRRRGKRGFNQNEKGTSPKLGSDKQKHPANKSVDMSSQPVNSDENGSPNHLKDSNRAIYQFPPKKTINDHQLFENKSKITTVQERTRGLSTKSTDTEENYTIFSTIESEDNEILKNKRSLLIYYGTEISDTIVGSYTAMNLFLSFYKEWKNLRSKAMQLLEDIINNLTSTNNRSNKTKDVIEMFGTGGRLVAAIPDFRAALAGRIVATLSDFFAKLFSSSPTLKDSGMNEFELMLCLQQDIDATSDMNIFGLQCDENFQETCKLIEEFHNCIQGWCFKDITEGVDTDFLEDISSLNPKHHVVYYRRLQRWIERLAENPTSDISKAFSRGFKDFPEALETTNLLYWRYHAQGIDTTVSFRSWDDIRELLQNGDSVAVVDVIKKIQNSILVLIKERNAMEKDVMELLHFEKKL